jgi:hypothetical protein
METEVATYGKAFIDDLIRLTEVRRKISLDGDTPSLEVVSETAVIVERWGKLVPSLTVIQNGGSRKTFGKMIEIESLFDELERYGRTSTSNYVRAIARLMTLVTEEYDSIDNLVETARASANNQTRTLGDSAQRTLDDIRVAFINIGVRKESIARVLQRAVAGKHKFAVLDGSASLLKGIRLFAHCDALANYVHQGAGINMGGSAYSGLLQESTTADLVTGVPAVQNVSEIFAGQRPGEFTAVFGQAVGGALPTGGNTTRTFFENPSADSIEVEVIITQFRGLMRVRPAGGGANFTLPAQLDDVTAVQPNTFGDYWRLGFRGVGGNFQNFGNATLRTLGGRLSYYWRIRGFLLPGQYLALNKQPVPATAVACYIVADIQVKLFPKQDFTETGIDLADRIGTNNNFYEVTDASRQKLAYLSDYHEFVKTGLNPLATRLQAVDQSISPAGFPSDSEFFSPAFWVSNKVAIGSAFNAGLRRQAYRRFLNYVSVLEETVRADLNYPRL